MRKIIIGWQHMHVRISGKHTQCLLNDIVAVSVRHQRQNIVEHFLEQKCALLRCAALQDALQHPATIQLHAHADHAAAHLEHNEIQMLRRNQPKTVLDHMVAVRVLGTFHDVALQIRHDLQFVPQLAHFDGLLDHPACVQIGRQRPNILRDVVDQVESLRRQANVEEFLDHEIGRRIAGQVEQFRAQLLENGNFPGVGRVAQLLLNELGAAVVARELGHMVDDIAEAPAAVAIGQKIL